MVTKNINKFRKARKLTLEELANEINMSYTGLRLALENDDFKISTLTRMAEVFNIPITDLLNENYDFSVESNKGNLGVGDNIKQTITNNPPYNFNEINSLKKEIAHLTELLRNKEQIIEGKNEIIEQLKRQIR